MTGKIIAVVNQKGGVGKTTTSMNLATAMAAINKKVLLIDLDPQGNLSTGLGLKLSERKPSAYDLLLGEIDNLADAIKKTEFPNLSIIPSEVDLYGAEHELLQEEDRLFRLFAYRQPFNDNFDYIFIDCPPSLGVLTVNALIAANSVLVPLQCEFFALEGLSQLIHTIDRVKNNFNKNLSIEGILLTMFDVRNNLSSDVVEDVRGHFGDSVFETIIPRNVRLSEAPSHGVPALVYDISCPGSKAYIKLVKEMLYRMQRSKTILDTKNA